MNNPNFLTGNHIINVALISWFLAQFSKLLLELFLHKKFSFKRIYGSGGMPSSHAAMTVGVAASVWKVCGFRSPEFGIAASFALVVMYDASNVRQAAGEQAKILNYMIRHWKENSPEMFGRELKELLGHTPFEVFVGALLGILVGILL